MNRRNWLLIAFLSAGITGCAAFKEIFKKDEGGPGQVSDLVGSIERVYVNSELSKEKAHAAVAALRTLASAEYKGDALSAYAAFIAAIDVSEAQAEELRENVEDMQDAADPVFEQWFDDLKAITNVEMRQRSRNRLLTTRERYDAIVAAVEPALRAYDAVNQSLRDHALFLGNDLNPDSVSEIRGEVRALTGRTEELDREFDACLQAAREYVDSAALPTISAADEPDPFVVPVSGADREEPRPQPEDR